LVQSVPFSTSFNIAEYGGTERLLQTVFTRFANCEYEEGIIVLRAEFGADWFTPILRNFYFILEHPYVILRHNGNDQSENGGFNSYVVFYMGKNVKSFCESFKNVGQVINLIFYCRLLE
jgi:hypothetical protein